jgi:hypothetical protein
MAEEDIPIPNWGRSRSRTVLMKSPLGQVKMSA